MSASHFAVSRLLRSLVLLALLAAVPAHAGGYFLLGYGPFSSQMAGTSTAVGFDTFSGASNPGKLFDAGNRLDLGMLLFEPYRRIERTDASNPIDDISATSKHELFFLPDGGFSHRINQQFAWGVTLYGNGGLNTDYRVTTNVPSTNFNPAACGTQAGNFLFGCGKVGFNLSQIILAPQFAWHFTPDQTVGIAPLIAYQRINIYGFQALEAFSSSPDQVTNRGYDPAFGIGVRIGWLGHVLPWLDLGAAYSTKVYSQKFTKYSGLIADHGSFDIPANYNVGFAVRPLPPLTIAIDVQRIEWHSIQSLGNPDTNSLRDPTNEPLGGHAGSGFDWRNENTYKLGFAYEINSRLTGRAGYNYGRRPFDQSTNSITFAMFTPNQYHQVSGGFTWAVNAHNDFQFAYERYIPSKTSGPSATSILGIGGTETSLQSVTAIYLAWSWRM